MFFSLPTLYTILVHAPEICNADFSSLRLAVCAAEILSGEIFNAWNGDWIGDRRVSRFDRNAQRLFVEHRWGGTGIIALGDREGDFPDAGAVPWHAIWDAISHSICDLVWHSTSRPIVQR